MCHCQRFELRQSFGLWADLRGDKYQISWAMHLINFIFRLLISVLSSQLFWPAESHAQTNNFFNSIPCLSQVSTTLDQWEAPTSWRKLISSESESLEIASPSDVAGVWIYLRVNPRETVATRKTVECEINVQWDNQSCQSQATIFLKKKSPSQAQRLFTDKDLQLLLNKGSAGVIYIWSPHMPLSISGIREISALAKRLKIDLSILMDPNASQDSAVRSVKQNHLVSSSTVKLAASELIQRNSIYHFPSYVFFKDHKILGDSRLGYDEPKRLEQVVREKLKL